MTVWVDIGNTRMKFGVGAAGQTRNIAEIAWREPGAQQRIADTLQGCSGSELVVSNVAGEQPLNLLSGCAAALGVAQPIQLANTRDLLGLRCGYSDRTQLGLDRWFAMLGAWVRGGRALCVIDLGTAGTADLVDAAGQHLGGCIFAGAETQRRALAANTANLPESMHDVTTPFAANTLEAIAAGTCYTVAASVDRLLAEAEKRVDGPVAALLTGGGARAVVPYLERSVQVVPTLVLDGIAAAWSDQTKRLT